MHSPAALTHLADTVDKLSLQIELLHIFEYSTLKLPVPAFP